MQINTSEMSDLIRERIKKFDVSANVRTEGTIVSLKDGIVTVHGLDAVMYSEILEFPGGVFG